MPNCQREGPKRSSFSRNTLVRQWSMSANFMISCCRFRGLNPRDLGYKTAALPDIVGVS